MSKRSILVLALAFVLGIAFSAYAEVQNVKVSGDITAYGISRNFSLKGQKNQRVENAMASIARIRLDADLTDNVATTVRLLNERYWGNETNNTSNSNSTNNNTEIDLDLAYVTLKEFLYSPLTLTVGRQELHFGNDMIVGDPDTNNNVTTASPFGTNNRDKDLTARKSFDAVRATLNYDPLVIDAIAAVVSHTDLNKKDDVNLFGVNVGYDVGKKNTKVEGYWFEKRTGTEGDNAVAIGKKAVDRIDTVGGRVVTQPIENLTYQLEAAYQFGKFVPITTGGTTYGNHVVSRKAWALETALTYNMPKVKFTPSITGLYSYFSGDITNSNANAAGLFNTNNGTYRGWDPMFENQKFGDIANALFNQTNVHVVGGILSLKPVEDVTLKGEYYAYWWAKRYPDGFNIVADARDSAANLKMVNKRFAGQEIDVTAMYDYTEDVQFGLMGGVFVPGGAFDGANNKLASELIGSMKVTF